MGSIATKDIKISNIKGVLIFLVVFGHLLELYKDDYYEFFVFIYAFHMPLFIFISGYLAKRVKFSKIIILILLYIMFQSFFYWLLYVLGEYGTFGIHFGIPHFHLWYLVSLGVWYGIAWFISKIPLNSVGKGLAFLLILTLSFLSRWYTDDVVNHIKPYYDNFSSYTLSYQRTLSFAPFFFAGFFINKPFLEKLYSFISNKKIQLVLFLGSTFIVFLYIQGTQGIESIFRGSFGTYRYMEENDGFSIYVIKMLAHYLIAGWLSFLILNMASRNNSTITKWGDHSLTIFLFHPVFVFILRNNEVLEGWETDVKVLFFFMLSIAISAILGSNLFVRATQYICKPYSIIEKIIEKVKAFRGSTVLNR